MMPKKLRKKEKPPWQPARNQAKANPAESQVVPAEKKAKGKRKAERRKRKPSPKPD